MTWTGFTKGTPIEYSFFSPGAKLGCLAGLAYLQQVFPTCLHCNILYKIYVSMCFFSPPTASQLRCRSQTGWHYVTMDRIGQQSVNTEQSTVLRPKSCCKNKQPASLERTERETLAKFLLERAPTTRLTTSRKYRHHSSPTRQYVFMYSTPCIKANLNTCSNRQKYTWQNVQLYIFIYYTDMFRSLLWPPSWCRTVIIQAIL